MIRKVLILIILGCLILGTAQPVLASGDGGSGGSGGSDSGSGSSSGNGGGSSDSGSSGNGGGSSDSGSSSGNSGSPSESGPSGSGSTDQSRSGTTGSTSKPSSGPAQEPSPEHTMTTGGLTVVPTQEQSRDRPQVTSEPTGEPTEVPSQDQSQDRSMSQDQARLDDQYLQKVRDRQSQLFKDPQLSRDQDRLNRELALYSISIAAPVSGINITQFVEFANQLNQSYLVIDPVQSRIQDRDPITRFFFGGDASAAQTLLQATAMNQDRLRLMEQNLQYCDCNQTVRDQLQQQLMTISQEQDRLRILANQTLQDTGIFGGLFR